MTNTIRISPEQMRSRAREYQTEAENIQTSICQMDRLLNCLISEWEGEASQAFNSRYNELRPSFISMQQLIEEISVSLDNTATAMEETDAKIARQFRG